MQNNTFSTLFVGQNLIKLSSVDSTNNYLKNMASNFEPLTEGTVIMADNQFAGRGQQENIWHTEPGKNLTFSIYLCPRFLSPVNQFSLNMIISLAICNALARFLPERPQIKWPNDIYYNRKKLGGILIENSISGNQLKSSIIGIGLNVNQQIFDTQIQSKAISMNQILHHDVNKLEVLAQICRGIEQYYLNLKANKIQVIKEDYIKNLFKYQTEALFKAQGQEFRGTISDVDNNGLLNVSCLNGQIKKFNFKEIEFLD